MPATRRNAAAFPQEALTITALLVVAAGTALWAFLLIPHRAPVTIRPPAPMIVVSVEGKAAESLKPSYIGAEFSTSIANGLRTVAVSVDLPQGDDKPRVTVAVYKPGLTPEQTRLYRTFTMTQYYEGIIDDIAYTEIRIPASWSLLDNGREIAGSLPRLVYLADGQDLATALDIGTRIPAAVQFDLVQADSYDYSGLAPTSVEARAVRFDAQTNTDPQPSFQGARPDVADQDDRHTFYAGALVGIAGGALTSAIPEALKLGRSRWPREPRTRPSQPTLF